MKEINPEAVTFAKNIATWETSPSRFYKSSLDSLLVGRDLIVIRLGENAMYGSEFNLLVTYI